MSATVIAPPTHPADGLFTFTADKARSLNACFDHVQSWERRHGGKIAAVTFADMLKQELSSHCGSVAYWCAARMYDARKIEPEEWHAFDRRLSEGYNSKYTVKEGATIRVQALMDLLLKRAKREGRV